MDADDLDNYEKILRVWIKRKYYGDYIFITANELVKIIAALKAAEARRNLVMTYKIATSIYSEPSALIEFDLDKLREECKKAEAAYAKEVEK